MVDTWSEGFGRPQTRWEKALYEDWLQAAQSCTPAELVQRFYRMYLDPDGSYPSVEVRDALQGILTNDACVNDFKYVLNRTCYILINTWSSRPWSRDAIPKLIHLFDQIPDEPGKSPHAVRLHDLACLFLQTPEYEALQKVARILEQANRPGTITPRAPIETLVYRYPFSYDYMLCHNSSDPVQQKAIRTMQIEAQRTFECNLSHYHAARKAGRAATNPTLLNDAQLEQALFQFHGKVYGSYTQRDFASHFRKSFQWARSYREFKRDLYQYLKTGLPGYGEGRFLSRLQRRLNDILARCDASALEDSLIDETCHELLYFLVIERSPNYDHSTFLDLVGNVGAALTIALLMKIVLLSKRAKYWLEKQFTLLFNHHASQSIADANWLVESLETLNVGLTANFPLRSTPTS